VSTGAFKVRTPGKINLSLLVGPPCGDGYHPICTLFAPVNLFDTMSFSLSAGPRSGRKRGISVRCGNIPQEKNLVMRAIRVVEEESGWYLSGEVEIEKGIPVAAGMAGGSSDAAAALRVAAALVAEAGGTRISEERLSHLALGLGADVPLFLEPGPALASGVGEVLEPVSLPSLPLVVVMPEEELQAGAVYRSLDESRPQVSQEDFGARCRVMTKGWRELCAALSSSDAACDVAALPQFRALMVNDLQDAALRLAPALEERLRLVGSRSRGPVLVSGSGPSTFVVCASAEEASGVAQDLTGIGLVAVRTNTLTLC